MPRPSDFVKETSSDRAHPLDRREDSKAKNSPHDYRIGGRLQQFKDQWNSTDDRLVLSIVSEGYRIDFTRRPQDHFIPSPISKNKERGRALPLAIQHLLEIGAIEEVPVEQHFTGVYSTLFVVPKKSGEWRAILNLKSLNRWVRKR